MYAAHASNVSTILFLFYHLNDDFKFNAHIFCAFESNIISLKNHFF
jgi:hypothetical protein